MCLLQHLTEVNRLIIRIDPVVFAVAAPSKPPVVASSRFILL